jgi:hypothetical protein
MAGETVLTRPADQESVDARETRADVSDPGDDATGSSHRPDSKGPIVIVAAPVRNENERVIAAFGLAFAADREFTTLLSTADLGQTGETYAFDADGVVLSSLRDEPTLRQVGLLEPHEPSPLKIHLRDPGGDMAVGYRPQVRLEDRPRTRMLRSAVTLRQEQSSEEQFDLNGYHNYRGLWVIGSWKWMPQHDFGVATELSVEEGYAPLWYVRTTFRWLFAVVCLLAVATILSTSSLVQAKGQVLSAQKLGQYTLQGLLGQGGMGKVYRAKHALLRRPTAVKVLDGEHADPDSVARFEREVQLTSQLTHPNTIQIFDYGRSADDLFYYAMEYLDGPTLDRLVQMEPELPVPRVVHILRQVCGSLREAHDQGLVHRDIKPQNIMLCCRGGLHDFAKVLDFGLVKSFATKGQTLTRPQFVGGTPAYMAPERLDDSERVDGRSDLYSLGAVAFYLLTGRPVFQGASAVEVLALALREKPPSPSTCGGRTLPVPLEELVVGCLAKSPDQRPSTIDQVLEVLDELAHAEPWTQQQAARWWRQKWSPETGVATARDTSTLA